MPLSFATLTSSSSGTNAKSLTVPSALYQYKVNEAFSAGVYTITTSPNTSQATVSFYNSNNQIYATATTVSGTITYNLASDAAGCYISTSTGSSVVTTITLVASPLAGTSISGTVDTITSSGTYNQTGQLYVLAIGGGGGGANGSNNYGGGGGGSGGLASGFIYTNTSIAVTIGARGNTAQDGGSTSFGNTLVANGGLRGGYTIDGAFPGNGGSPLGVQGGHGAASGTSFGGVNNKNGSVSIAPAPNITTGTIGGGGGGTYGGVSGIGGGSGIGTGGNAGASANGYGSGGGGGNFQNGAGGAGSPGIVYVLRGF